MSFDEQPDGDIHGECAAEIRRLEGDVTIWRNSAEAQTERLKEAEGAIADGKKPDLVPGVVHCARCNFRLNRVTLYMGNGAIGPGGSETEQCPNGCGPMWPVTWKQEAEDAYKTAESQFERAKAAEDQIDACRPYLKEGETPAECLARNRADIVRLMGKWGAEKMRSAKLGDDLDKIAQTTGSDDPCRPHLKEGETVADALGRLEHSESFYRRRCEALQAWQSSMRDPERVIVCDILANGFTLDQPFAGDRYAGLRPVAPTTEGTM